MNNEARIQERRTIEATKKGLMGPSGKFGAILKNLGEPIISHEEGGSLYDVRYLDDPLKLEEDSPYDLKPGTPEEITDQIKTSQGTHDAPEGDEWRAREVRETNYDTNQIGWHFSGLGYSVHLEIKYEEWNKELIVTYKGYEVYKETAGELKGYNPFEEWEDKINDLYEIAMRKLKKRKQEDKGKAAEIVAHSKGNWVDKMRLRWGL